MHYGLQEDIFWQIHVSIHLTDIPAKWLWPNDVQSWTSHENHDYRKMEVSLTGSCGTGRTTRLMREELGFLGHACHLILQYKKFEINSFIALSNKPLVSVPQTCLILYQVLCNAIVKIWMQHTFILIGPFGVHVVSQRLRYFPMWKTSDNKTFDFLNGW